MPADGTDEDDAAAAAEEEEEYEEEEDATVPGPGVAPVNAPQTSLESLVPEGLERQYQANLSFPESQLRAMLKTMPTTPWQGTKQEMALRLTRALGGYPPTEADAPLFAILESDEARKMARVIKQAAKAKRAPRGEGQAQGQAKSKRGQKPIRRCRVISNNKLGVLSKPDAEKAKVSRYVMPGEVFVVIKDFVNLGDDRKYWRLKDENGWLPQCSRKDATKVVVEELPPEVPGQEIPSAPPASAADGAGDDEQAEGEGEGEEVEEAEEQEQEDAEETQVAVDDPSAEPAVDEPPEKRPRVAIEEEDASAEQLLSPAPGDGEELEAAVKPGRGRGRRGSGPAGGRGRGGRAGAPVAEAAVAEDVVADGGESDEVVEVESGGIHDLGKGGRSGAGSGREKPPPEIPPPDPADLPEGSLPPGMEGKYRALVDMPPNMLKDMVKQAEVPSDGHRHELAIRLIRQLAGLPPVQADERMFEARRRRILLEQLALEPRITKAEFESFIEVFVAQADLKNTKLADMNRAIEERFGELPVAALKKARELATKAIVKRMRMQAAQENAIKRAQKTGRGKRGQDDDDEAPMAVDATGSAQHETMPKEGTTGEDTADGIPAVAEGPGPTEAATAAEGTTAELATAESASADMDIDINSGAQESSAQIEVIAAEVPKAAEGTTTELATAESASADVDIDINSGAQESSAQKEVIVAEVPEEGTTGDDTAEDMPKASEVPGPTEASTAPEDTTAELGTVQNVSQDAWKVGERVQRRDEGEEWAWGYVKSTNPLEVTVKDDPNGDEAYQWDEVRKASLRVGDPVKLTAAGQTVDSGYDWSEDPLAPGDVGEIVKLDEVTGQFLVRGPKGLESWYEATDIEIAHKVAPKEGTS